jgi:hypothetical protein
MNWYVTARRPDGGLFAAGDFSAGLSREDGRPFTTD